MSIKIKKVSTAKDLKTFIYLPEKIHSNHESWIHPLYMDDEKFFNPKKNSAFSHNTTVLFLAYENETPVGRIMGIIPLDFNKKNNTNTVRFSYFECFENKEIFDALLSAIEEWAKEMKCDQVIGPMGFSDKEPQGFLTKGYNEPTMMVTNCSFQFMKEYIEQNNYSPYVELCQYDIPLKKDIVERYQKLNERVKRNLDITVHEFTATKKIKPFIRPVFKLINTTYTEIYGFTPLTEEEVDEFANRFLPLLNPKLIKIITNKDSEVIAFVIAMPDLSQAIKKSKGRILPFGWYHLLKASKKSKRLVLLLGAVQNKMQNKGLDAVLATSLIGSALELGFDKMDSHLIMRENIKMRREIERLEGHTMYKEYCIYSKNIVTSSK